MKLNLFELLAPLFQATAAGHATVDAPKPGVFAGLLLQLQSGTPGTKQTDNPLPVTHPEASSDAEEPSTKAALDAPETDAGLDAPGDEGTDPRTESSGPPAHRHLPAVALPEPALLRALHSNGAPFQAHQGATATDQLPGPLERVNGPVLEATEPSRTPARDGAKLIEPALPQARHSNDAPYDERPLASVMNESPARSEIVGKRDPEAAKASGTPPRNGPTPVEPAVQLRPEMADVARAVMPERAVASGVEAKPPVLGANAPAGNEGKRIAPKSTMPIFTSAVDADHAARAESIARTASKARAPVRPLDRGDVLMPSVRDVRSVTPKVSVPLGPVLSADSVRSDSADPAVLRGQAVSPNPSPAEPQVPSSGRQFHPVTTDASVLGAVEPNGRARKTPEVVAPTIAVPKRGSVTVPPPSEDAFLPTDAAQNRAVRAVEVLSALRMGEIPESAARVSEPPKPETAAVAIRVRDPVRMELPIDKAEKAGPTRLTAANVELTTFGREPVADRATPAERVVSSGHLRTEQSTVPPSAAMEGTPPAGIATDSVAAAPTRSPIEAPVALREQVAHQIVRQVRHVVTGGEQTVAIKLVPESLGELHISVTSSKDVLEIVLTSSSRHVRQTLEQQLHALRETLIREGIDVTRATIASPVTTDNELQGSFTRAGNGQHAGTERQGSNQPWSGSSHRDPDLANPDKRSGNSHHGKLNVFA